MQPASRPFFFIQHSSFSKPKKKRPRKSFLPSFSAQIHEKSIHHSSSIAWPLPNLQYHHGQKANSYRPLLRHLGATESLPGMGWVKKWWNGMDISCKRVKLALKNGRWKYILWCNPRCTHEQEKPKITILDLKIGIILVLTGILSEGKILILHIPIPLPGRQKSFMVKNFRSCDFSQPDIWVHKKNHATYGVPNPQTPCWCPTSSNFSQPAPTEVPFLFKVCANNLGWGPVRIPRFVGIFDKLIDLEDAEGSEKI